MRTLLLLLFAPRYRMEMPADAPGSYIAEAFTHSLFGPECVKFRGRFEGRRSAYFQARWAALCLDMATPHADGEIGIGWRIKSCP